MKKRILATILSVTVLMVSFGGCSNSSGSANGGTTPAKNETAATTASQDVVTLRFAGQAPEGTLADALNKELVTMVSEATDGRIVVEYYPYNQLGDWDTVFNELMMGTIDMAHIAQPDSYNPLASAAFIPYLSTNYEGLKEMIGKGSYIDGVISEVLNDMNIKYLGSFCGGLSGVGTTKEVNSPADVTVDKGIIIRTPGMSTYQIGLDGLGFRTAALPYSDVFSSLQTGVVDGFGGGPAHTSYLSFKEAIKYYYEYNVNSESTAFMVSAATWDKLSEEDKIAIESVCQELSERSFDEAEAYEDDMANKLEEDGIIVVRFTPEELELIAEKNREYSWPKLEEIYGKEFFDGLRDAMK